MGHGSRKREHGGWIQDIEARGHLRWMSAIECMFLVFGNLWPGFDFLLEET